MLLKDPSHATTDVNTKTAGKKEVEDEVGYQRGLCLMSRKIKGRKNLWLRTEDEENKGRG